MKIKITPQRAAGVLGLTVGLAMTLAANLAYAVPKGAVVIGVGLCCPLVLPLALWIRSTLPEPTSWWRRVPRELAMLAVAGPAAAISYAHSYSLLLEHDPRWQTIAVLAPLSADGLAALSTLALSATRQKKGGHRTVTAPAPQRKPPRSTPRQTEGVSPPVTPDITPQDMNWITGELIPSVSLADRVARWLHEERTKHGAVRTIAEETEAAQPQFPGVSAMTVRRARKILEERAS